MTSVAVKGQDQAVPKVQGAEGSHSVCVVVTYRRVMMVKGPHDPFGPHGPMARRCQMQTRQPAHPRPSQARSGVSGTWCRTGRKAHPGQR